MEIIHGNFETAQEKLEALVNNREVNIDCLSLCSKNRESTLLPLHIGYPADEEMVQRRAYPDGFECVFKNRRNGQLTAVLFVERPDERRDVRLSYVPKLP